METLREQCNKLKTGLETIRSPWLPYWQDLADYIAPWHFRITGERRNQKTRRNKRIIDNTAIRASNVLTAGLMTGVTNPAMPWFKLTTQNPELAKYGPVKHWLYTVTQAMYAVLIKSNYYNTLPSLYTDIGVFGTGARGLAKNIKTTIHGTNYPLGTYSVSTNELGVVDTIVLDHQMSVRQVVGRFARRDERSGSLDLSMMSQTLKTMWQNNNTEVDVDVVQAIKPNPAADPNKLHSKYLPYISIFYENSGDQQKLLDVKGFNEFPVPVARWAVLGNDAYGNSPGMNALGDAVALQIYHKDKAKAVKKMIDPPMTAPPSMRNQRASLLSGDITYVSTTDRNGGFKPAHETRFPLNEARQDIQEHQFRIQQAFFSDVFLMISNSDDPQKTATEIAERKQEKLTMLGPVLNRLNSDLYGPDIDRVFYTMMRQRMIPLPPKELQGQDLKVEFISILHQAQKMVGINSVDRLLSVTGRMAEVDATVVDKIDLDQTVDEYAEMLGVPPTIVRNDDQVANIRQQRAELQQQQRAQEQAAQRAATAKDLSQTQLESDSALSQLLGIGGSAA